MKQLNDMATSFTCGDRPAPLACLVMLALLSMSLAVRPCQAQMMLAVPAAATPEGDPNQPKRPFSLPAQKTEVADSLADFRRLADKGTWERAFKALEKVQEADPNALTPSTDGLYMPTRLVVRQALAELPPAGKQAYRLFHDADAKALYDQAQGKDEIEKLRKVVTDHFITSVGDSAADRLGDIYFEQGEMGKAAECWQAVLNWCPESALPRVRLLVKSALAEARGGHWDAFVELNREVHQRHSDERVMLGGKQVSAAEYLDGFEKKNRTSEQSSTVAGGTPAPDFRLPARETPA
ncbi:MAG TPA: hypothetical protein VFI31_25640, partial [Pirellulales bacterium]|nr:hypothetical protein [Pirellulales bacterium]